MRLFVIGAIGRTEFGELLAVPIGVEFGSNRDEARERATCRWPNCSLVPPRAWETVDPKVRLLAIDNDRQMM